MNMMSHKTILLLLFSVFISKTFGQISELSDYEVIDFKEFYELIKANPKLKTFYKIDNSKMLSHNQFESISKKINKLNYRKTYYKNTVNNYYLVDYTKLSEAEIKLKQQAITDKLNAKRKSDKQTRHNLDGTKLDSLTLIDINNNKHTLESLKGQVIVINFWFINCKPCVAEIPDLNEIKNEFKNQPVSFFAISYDSAKALNKFLETNDFKFTIIPKGSAIIKQFGIPYYPYNVIIDKKGQVEYISDVLALDILKKLKRKIKKHL